MHLTFQSLEFGNEAPLQLLHGRVFGPQNLCRSFKLLLQTGFRSLPGRCQIGQLPVQDGHFGPERVQLVAPALQETLFLTQLSFQSLEFSSQAPLQLFHGRVFCLQRPLFFSQFVRQRALGLSLGGLLPRQLALERLQFLIAFIQKLIF